MARMTRYTVAALGHTFTRKSARPYSHVVVASGLTPAYAADRRAQDVAYFRTMSTTCSSDAERAAFAGKLAEAEADPTWLPIDVAAKNGSGVVMGWCGRLDLALTLARKERGRGLYADVTIVDVATGAIVSGVA